MDILDSIYDAETDQSDFEESEESFSNGNKSNIKIFQQRQHKRLEHRFRRSYYSVIRKEYPSYIRLDPQLLKQYFHLSKREAMEKLRVTGKTIDLCLEYHKMIKWPYGKIKKSEIIIEKLTKRFNDTENKEIQQEYQNKINHEKILLSHLRNGNFYPNYEDENKQAEIKKIEKEEEIEASNRLLCLKYLNY